MSNAKQMEGCNAWYHNQRLDADVCGKNKMEVYNNNQSLDAGTCGDAGLSST